jgi:hypothetical protein
MKYTERSFEEYRGYLESIRDQLPPHVYAFATDVNRYSLDSPQSLHDCWLASLSVFEERSPHRPFRPAVRIRLRLLGQRHDRYINLTYHDVRGYELVGCPNRYNPADTFHGDVATHEVRFEHATLVHEIQFVSESRVLIQCGSFDVAEENIEQGHPADRQ